MMDLSDDKFEITTQVSKISKFSKFLLSRFYMVQDIIVK